MKVESRRERRRLARLPNKTQLRLQPQIAGAARDLTRVGARIPLSSALTPHSKTKLLIKVMFLGTHPSVEELRLQLENELQIAPLHFGDVKYAEDYIPRTNTVVLVADLLSTQGGLKATANFLFRTGNAFPEIAIGLIGDSHELKTAFAKLPETQRNRLIHYYPIRRQPTDADATLFLKNLVTAHHRLQARQPATPRYKYDFALSYASEDRHHALALVSRLHRRRLKKVFYDDLERHATWGAELRQRLDAVYGVESRYCIPLMSKAYKDKPWTKFEFKTMKKRAGHQPAKEFLLPIQIDGTRLRGISLDVAYMSIGDGYTNIANELLQRFSSDIAERAGTSIL